MQRWRNQIEQQNTCKLIGKECRPEKNQINSEKEKRRKRRRSEPTSLKIYKLDDIKITIIDVNIISDIALTVSDSYIYTDFKL